jgi:hypothetical protein
MMRAITTLLLGAALLTTGCETTSVGTNAKWYAPTTWPIWSGKSKIDAAKKAELKAATARDQGEALASQIVHAAHVEVRKATVAAAAIKADEPAIVFTRRALRNAGGLLAQVDPLTAAEDAAALQLVDDALSPQAVRAARAEGLQAAAEKNNSALSQKLAEANAQIEKLESAARAANATERATHLENLKLANELRAQRWRFWIAVVGLVVVGGFALYAKFALGGVGAALHAAGAPAKLVSELDANLSTFGQWLVRSGRVAAAKVAAARRATADEPSPIS